MKIIAEIASNPYEVNLPIVSPEITKAYWTDAKGNIISKERLENTVYFHIETKGIPDNSEIKLQLFDEDTLSDDNTFAGKEERTSITIKSNKGSAELYLPIEWTEDLNNEGIVSYRKLYWKATYGNRIKNKKIETFLEIRYSDRTLYVAGSNDKFMLPELYDMDGSELVYTIIDDVHEKAEKHIKDFVKEKLNHIALAKLAKGYMVNNHGKVYTGITARGTQRELSEKICYTNEGIAIRTVQGRNFTLPNGITTKGISQYDYFTKYGSKAKLLGLLKHTGKIFNAFELFDMLSSSLNPNHNQPLSLPSTGNIVADIGLIILGMVAQAHFAEMDEGLEMIRREELEKAKEQGINRVEQLVNRWIANGRATTSSGDLKDGRLEYRIMGISNETASKIIQGEIRIFNEISEKYNAEIKILYRKEKDPIKGDNRYIIETFFVNT